MIYRIFRVFAHLEAGRCCRVCGEPVLPNDAFGLSEGVCSACR